MKKEQSSNSTPEVKYALAEKYKEESEKKRFKFTTIKEFKK